MRAVVFDLYNTLLPGGSRDARDACSREMAHALGVDPQHFADLFRASASERFRGELGDLAQTLRALAERLGARPSEAAVRLAAVTRTNFIRRLLWPPAQTLSTLDALRARGIKLGLLSNCSVETAVLWSRQPLSTRFDAVGLSCQVGLAKPDPGFFLKICGELGEVPTECLYVGDGEDNELAAAAALGMRAVRTTQFADSDPAWRGETITDLNGPPLFGVGRAIGNVTER